MVSYRLENGSIIILEATSKASIRIGSTTHTTLGDAVNASSVKIRNVHSGLAWTDNRIQTFYGDTSFAQPITSPPATAAGHLPNLGQVTSLLSSPIKGPLWNNALTLSGDYSLKVIDPDIEVIGTTTTAVLKLHFTSGLPGLNRSIVNSSAYNVLLTTPNTIGNDLSGLRGLVLAPSAEIGLQINTSANRWLIQ